MRTVKDAINCHNAHHGYDQEDHIARVLVRGKLGGDIALVPLHVRVEDERVDDHEDLNRSHEHVHILARLLLLDLWEEAIHELVVKEEPSGPLQQGELALALSFVVIDHVVLRDPLGTLGIGFFDLVGMHLVVLVEEYLQRVRLPAVACVSVTILITILV